MGRHKGIPNQKKPLPLSAGYVIYALVEPITHKVFYVGATNKLTVRFNQHIFEGRTMKTLGCNKDKAAKINAILKSGGFPGVVILEVTTKRHHSASERKWQRVMKRRGFRLTNDRIGALSTIERLQQFSLGIQVLVMLETASAVLREKGEAALSTQIEDALEMVCAHFDVTKNDWLMHGRESAMEKFTKRRRGTRAAA